jgi:DinB superfamily
VPGVDDGAADRITPHASPEGRGLRSRHAEPVDARSAGAPPPPPLRPTVHMPLYPEQQRALAYAHKRGTASPVDAIRSRVAGTYAEIEGWVEGVGAHDARARTTASGWSVQEVVDHLVESDRLAVDQLRDLLAGRSSKEPIPASLQSARPLELDWSALRTEFRRVHQEITTLLEATTDDVPIEATAAIQMVVQCADEQGRLVLVEWVEHFDWKAYAILLHAHNREHIAQLQRILAALGT